MKSNKNIYSSWAAVKKYSKQNFIFPEEKFLLNQMSKMKQRYFTFLDMGVGAGRTTVHFKDMCQNYIGIDYSESMIKYCSNEFRNVKNCDFFHLDACNMHSVEDDSIDISLFSFNGIDYVSLEKRINILREVRKKTKNKGFFVFSAHNINYLPKLLKIYFPKNPIKIPSAIYRYFGIRMFNDLNVWEQKNDFIQISDGDSNNFNLKTSYINPIFQINMLNENGFKNVKVILNEYESTSDQNVIENIDNPWIYYICQVEK